MNECEELWAAAVQRSVCAPFRQSWRVHCQIYQLRQKSSLAFFFFLHVRCSFNVTLLLLLLFHLRKHHTFLSTGSGYEVQNHYRSIRQLLSSRIFERHIQKGVKVYCLKLTEGTKFRTEYTALHLRTLQITRRTGDCALNVHVFVVICCTSFTSKEQSTAPVCSFLEMRQRLRKASAYKVFIRGFTSSVLYSSLVKRSCTRF